MSIDPKDCFVSYVSDRPPLTGSRHWYDLSGAEQDQFLISCFSGPAARSEIEKSLNLYDRIALSLAHDLLSDLFYNFTPKTVEQGEQLIARRSYDLQDTLLGERLMRAIARKEMMRNQHLGGEYYNDDPLLFFEYLDAQKTRGFEYLSPVCTQSISQLKNEDEAEWKRMSPAERQVEINAIAADFESQFGSIKPKNIKPSKLETVAKALRCKAAIDLIELGKKEPEKAIRGHFANHLVLLAYDMVYSYTPDGELITIRDCLRYLIRRLQWKYGFTWLPLGSDSYSRALPEDSPGELIASSIVLTMLRYSQSAREWDTGLGGILYSEFLNGIERACVIARSEGIENALGRLPKIKVD